MEARKKWTKKLMFYFVLIAVKTLYTIPIAHYAVVKNKNLKMKGGIKCIL